MVCQTNDYYWLLFATISFFLIPFKKLFYMIIKISTVINVISSNSNNSSMSMSISIVFYFCFSGFG